MRALRMTENPLHSDAEPRLLTTEFPLMPRRGLGIGLIVLIAGNGVLVAVAPEEHRVLTIALVLVVNACLGAVFTYFRRLRCRLEVPRSCRALRWSIGKEHRQLALDEIAQVTTVLDQASDNHAHHVVFELRNGKPVHLSDYSWSIEHAAELARRIREFLEAAQAVADGSARAGR